MCNGPSLRRNGVTGRKSFVTMKIIRINLNFAFIHLFSTFNDRNDRILMISNKNVFEEGSTRFISPTKVIKIVFSFLWFF